MGNNYWRLNPKVVSKINMADRDPEHIAKLRDDVAQFLVDPETKE